jgi:stage II sporulation protein M
MTIPFSESYKECKATIADARLYIIFSFLLFTFAIVLGFNYLNDSKIINDSLLDSFKNMRTDSYLIFVSSLFFHNITIAYLSLRIGILLGIFPFITIINSGVVIGWLFANFPQNNYLKLFTLMLPHGVFELPAMFIAWGIGFWRCKLLFIPNYDLISKQNVREIHKIFIFVVFPLLLLAAFIEAIPLVI